MKFKNTSKLLLTTASELEACFLLSKLNHRLIDLPNTAPGKLYLCEHLQTQTSFYLLLTGIGKTNAAYAITQVLNQNVVQAVIWFGLAGVPFPKAQIGDLCLAEHTIDLDLGYCLENGQREAFKFQTGSEKSSTDPELRASLRQGIEGLFWPERPPALAEPGSKSAPSIHKGTVVCGDTFWHALASSEYAQACSVELTGCDYVACSMEANTVGVIAMRYQLPFAALLCASNYDRPLRPAERESFRQAFAAGSLNYAAAVLGQALLNWLQN